MRRLWKTPLTGERKRRWLDDVILLRLRLAPALISFTAMNIAGAFSRRPCILWLWLELPKLSPLQEKCVIQLSEGPAFCGELQIPRCARDDKDKEFCLGKGFLLVRCEIGQTADYRPWNLISYPLSKILRSNSCMFALLRGEMNSHG